MSDKKDQRADVESGGVAVGGDLHVDDSDLAGRDQHIATILNQIAIDGGTGELLAAAFSELYARVDQLHEMLHDNGLADAVRRLEEAVEALQKHPAQCPFLAERDLRAQKRITWRARLHGVREIAQTVALVVIAVALVAILATHGGLL